MDLKRYNKLKDEVDGLVSNAHKAEGALREVMSTIQKEFGCKTLQEAEELLVQLEHAAERGQDVVEQALTEFEQAYGDRLR